MRNVAAATSILVTATFLLAACGAPMGPIPAGELDGDVNPWPEDWGFAEEIENVLLETNPEDPYSVTVWGVAHHNSFYITGASVDNVWVSNLIKHAQMKLSVSGSLYLGRATEVTDRDEMVAVLDQYVSKYDFERSEGDNFIEDGGVIFRLSER